MIPHFVTAHREQMARLLADPATPTWRAMDLAIGGNVQRNALASGRRIMEAVDLSKPTKLLDFGCGYGNLLHALPRERLDYTGVDVVEELLDIGCTSFWDCRVRFLLNEGYGLPALYDNEFDVACAFSVFSHLYLHEVAVYIEELHRVLKPGGKLIFTFWEQNSEGMRQFDKTLGYLRQGVVMPPNTMMSIDMANYLGAKAGFSTPDFIRSTPDDYGPFNQTTAILEKPFATP